MKAYIEFDETKQNETELREIIAKLSQYLPNSPEARKVWKAIRKEREDIMELLKQVLDINQTTKDVVELRVNIISLS